MFVVGPTVFGPADYRPSFARKELTGSYVGNTTYFIIYNSDPNNLWNFDQVLLIKNDT